jgi:hypothetical protein
MPSPALATPAPQPSPLPTHTNAPNGTSDIIRFSTAASNALRNTTGSYGVDGVTGGLAWGRVRGEGGRRGAMQPTAHSIQRGAPLAIVAASLGGAVFGRARGEPAALERDLVLLPPLAPAGAGRRRMRRASRAVHAGLFESSRPRPRTSKSR